MPSDLPSKATAVLAARISDAIQGLARPWQSVRIARAEAKAEVIRAEGEIKAAEMRQRALARFEAEQVRNQANMESILRQAFPMIEPGAPAADVDLDWLAQFFDRCRLVGDEGMQRLWARMLSGEANAPGRYSKRAVQVLGSLGQTDAKLFELLCGFVVEFVAPGPEIRALQFIPGRPDAWFAGPHAVVFMVDRANGGFYGQRGLGRDQLFVLSELGLIRVEEGTGIELPSVPMPLGLRYGSHTLRFSMYGVAASLFMGFVSLTTLGRELASVVKPAVPDEHLDHLIEQWFNMGINEN